jgi:nucleoside-diphosphate-sugar epimerase
MCKKVLVLGGTGAMGVYMVPELIKMGYAVDVYALDKFESDNPRLNYYVANVTDIDVLKEVLSKKYDAVVDFMIWGGDSFFKVADLFLNSTSHYIYLSSYRVYADEEHPIKETSPRLYDIMKERDSEFFATPDYSLYKAKGEEYLKNSGKNNWTIVRPAVTYSKRRVQLVTLEGYAFVPRALDGKKVIIPKEALGKKATMSWAGDVGKMLARLVLNEKAYGEAYTASTSESHTWGEIADYYKELIGLEVYPVDTETYINVLFDENWRKAGRYQLIYDRLFDRVIDNSKILEVTGMKQEELTPLYEGLKRELSGINKDTNWINVNNTINLKMDEFFDSLS